MTSGDDGSGRIDAGLARRIAVSRTAAKIVLTLEALAPLLLAPLSVAALYVAFSWFGLFRLLPLLVVKPVAILFAIAFLWSLRGLLSFNWPDDSEANRRIETESGLSHRAISALEDHPATSSGFADALWREHVRRMARSIGPLSAGTPAPGIADHDRYALRALPVLALFVAFGFSYSNHAGRLTDPLHTVPGAAVDAGLRVDAWVTPPAYTRKPPVFLTARTDGEADGAQIAVPAGSTLTVRLSGEDADEKVTYTPVVSGKAVQLAADGANGKAPVDGGMTYQMPLTMPGTLAAGGSRWSFDIVRDTPPVISFDGEPRSAVNGALEIGFATSDDYGVVSAKAVIEPIESEKGAVALFPPPEFRLDLPRSDAREAKGLTSHDLTEHPLSGKKVRLTLVATDAAGQEGRSEPKEIILPARNFHEPLAAAAAEERQVFSLDERKLYRAIELNEALFLRPEETIPNLTNYLLLSSAGERMRLARKEADLKNVADYLWQIAIGIEGGDVATAEQKVKNAQQALADALNRNASDEEIRKLTEDLRKAMKDLMQALAKQMQNNPDGNQNAAVEQKMIRQQDLEKMLDDIQKLAESGSRDEARNLLNQMQRMMNNLQTARPGQNNQRGNDAMRQQMDKLGNILQDQKKLMDETFSKEQALRDRMQFGDPQPDSPQNGEPQAGDQQPGEPRSGQDQQQNPLFEDPQLPPGAQQAMPQDPKKPQQPSDPKDSMTKDQLKQALKDLSRRQQGLEKQLNELQQGLKKLGIKPGEGFGEAGKEMRGASNSLQKGDGQDALGAQGRAIESLRKGASDMMKQLAQNGEGSGSGQNQPGHQGTDPLGRPEGRQGPDLGENVKIPDQFDTERAREILESIRRKLGDNASPELERQYLERLLKLQ